MEEWTKPQTLQAFADYVSPGKLKTYQLLGMEIVPARREGSKIWDKDGKSYINCRSSGGVFNLGHRPPEMVAALKQALETLDLGDHLLLSEWRARLGKRLAELTPGDLQYTTFGVSGGEAVDLAIKLARGYTRRPGIISAQGGYHGHTGFALATGEDSFKEFFGPLAPGFSQVPFGDIKALEQAAGKDTAAVIFETIPATLGVAIPPDDYLPAVRRICDDQGAVMIIDEVQAGLGRTGRLWAIDEYGVIPDIMVLAKGLAGSLYPMSATCYRPHLQSFFDEHPFVHVSTCGGAEVGCAVTLAALERHNRAHRDAAPELWLYRGAWQEWPAEQIDMAVPLSPAELRRKRFAIFRHQSQKDQAMFPGPFDSREFWQRAEERNIATANLYDQLGLPEYHAIEAFARWPIKRSANTREQLAK
jgi:acetylornithine/succinyldiaminopimelate/putrescine aminotransferase